MGFRLPRLAPVHARYTAGLIATLFLGLLAGGCIEIKNSYKNATPIVLSEWAITAADGGALPEFKPGRVALSVHNAGKVPHEVIILRTKLAPGALPMRATRVDEKATGDVYGAIHVPQSGDTQNAAVQLRAGTYVFVCNIAGHYLSGMHTTVTVR
jgi:uncharacterized cupredoxin-like copper-binding protein